MVKFDHKLAPKCAILDFASGISATSKDFDFFGRFVKSCAKFCKEPSLQNSHAHKKSLNLEVTILVYLRFHSESMTSPDEYKSCCHPVAVMIVVMSLDSNGVSLEHSIRHNC